MDSQLRLPLESKMVESAKDDVMVVQTTAAHFRLRLGEQVLEIYNRSYDPVGQNAGTGTTSPDVVRTVVSSP